MFIHFAVMKGENGRILYDCPHGGGGDGFGKGPETNLVIRLKLDGVGIKKVSTDNEFGNVYVGDSDIEEEDSRKILSTN